MKLDGMLRSHDISFALDNIVHDYTDYMESSNDYEYDEMEDADIKYIVIRIFQLKKTLNVAGEEKS